MLLLSGGKRHNGSNGDEEGGERSQDDDDDDDDGHDDQGDGQTQNRCSLAGCLLSMYKMHQLNGERQGDRSSSVKVVLFKTAIAARSAEAILQRQQRPRLFWIFLSLN